MVRVVLEATAPLSTLQRVSRSRNTRVTSRRAAPLASFDPSAHLGSGRRRFVVVCVAVVRIIYRAGNKVRLYGDLERRRLALTRVALEAAAALYAPRGLLAFLSFALSIVFFVIGCPPAVLLRLDLGDGGAAHVPVPRREASPLCLDLGRQMQDDATAVAVPRAPHDVWRDGCVVLLKVRAACPDLDNRLVDVRIAVRVAVRVVGEDQGLRGHGGFSSPVEAQLLQLLDPTGIKAMTLLLETLTFHPNP